MAIWTDIHCTVNGLKTSDIRDGTSQLIMAVDANLQESGAIVKWNDEILTGTHLASKHPVKNNPENILWMTMSVQWIDSVSDDMSQLYLSGQIYYCSIC